MTLKVLLNDKKQYLHMDPYQHSGKEVSLVLFNARGGQIPVKSIQDILLILPYPYILEIY